MSLLRRGYFSSAANVLRSSPKILHVLKRGQLPWQWSMNMIKGLWCRIQQCLGTFFMLLVEVSSETGLFRHLSNHFLGVCNFGNTRPVRVIFFSKYSKFKLDYKKIAKKQEIFFCFIDNWIWIGINKLPLWRRRYFSPAANVLTSSANIFQVNEREFFQLNFLCSDGWLW